MRSFWIGFAALGLVLGGCAMQSGEDESTDGADIQQALPAYLALGDSVAFGDNPHLAHDGTGVDKFVGYPSDVAKLLHLNVTNVACAGESSSGFLSFSGADNGCHENKASGTLHVEYASTQVDYAVSFLKAHPATKLVTINIGANDLLIMQHACKKGAFCEAMHLPAALLTYRSNLKKIYRAIREDAGYTGTLVALTYYVPDYNNHFDTLAMSTLNDVAKHEVQEKETYGYVADGYGAMKAAATAAHGDLCKAGLLIPKDDGTCDIHPTEAGRAVLARAVKDAVDRAETNAAPE